MGIAVWEDNVSEISIGNKLTKTWYENNSYIYWKDSTRINFSYTWEEQTFVIPRDWIYKLEVWGAQGWSSSGRASNQWWYWWYACWKVFLSAWTVLKIYVWEQWKNNGWWLTAVAFNWGWKWWYSNYNSSNDRNWWGWGGTDIRIGWNTLYHRLIVAWWWAGWHAYSNYFSSLYWGWENWWVWGGWRWGTQTWWGSFWVWGSSSSNWEWNRWCMNWGWWGWYWWRWQERSSSDTWYSDFVSWGWSWFVWTGQDTVPSGYLVSEDYILSETQNIAWNQEMPNHNGTWTITWNTWSWFAVISCSFFIPPEEKITQAWVYHNPQLGLISMSADGEHWITISDKNAGAWSSDLEDPNSIWGYYQFGNIHWFWVLPEPIPPEPPEPTNPREPWEHTLAYYKLEWDTDDYMWNYASGWNSNIDYETLASWQQVVKMTSSNAWIMIPWWIANAIWSGDFTISLWVYVTWNQWWSGLIFWSWYDTSPYPWPNIWWRYDSDVIRFRLNDSTYMSAQSAPSTFENNRRVHICWTRINWVNYWYINWELECQMESSIWISNWNAGYMISRYGSTQSLATWSMWSKVICENIWWPASKVRAYYDWNKQLYWISN